MVDLTRQPFYLSSDQIKWVEETLNKLSLEQKVGQLFCVMGGGDFLPEQLKEMVSKGMVGGILYRPAPADEIRARYKELDAVALVPLLKAANLEEGGELGLSVMEPYLDGRCWQPQRMIWSRHNISLCLRHQKGEKSELIGHFHQYVIWT